MVAARRLLPASLAGLVHLLLPTAVARQVQYISGVSLDGVINKQLPVDRTPALYTGDFGDCLGGQSLFNVTKFDAAFYYDNSTVLFHLDGTTSIRREDLMMYISVEAYGESRFSMTVNPCEMNVDSLCPLNASRPITAFALIPIGPLQVSNIPSIAFQIPDLDGFARIQIFANSTQSEIGCFQATMKNGISFSQPLAISPVLGIFTAVAIISSFATAIYGVSIPHMRTHYAHSLSVLVIFETFQSIYFSGALSLNWPSVLPAWWSNFAWAAGLVPVSSMISSLNSFVGLSGDTGHAGAAGSVIINNGGGLIKMIYGAGTGALSAKRSPKPVHRDIVALAKRQPFDPNNPFDYNWNGDPAGSGLPLPAEWHGFAGTLAPSKIPVPSAFMVGFIWLLIALGLVTLVVAGFKCMLEVLAKWDMIKEDRLAYFRSHWTGYLQAALLRSLVIAYFAAVVLCMVQFSSGGRAGPIAIAAVVFVGFLIGVGGLATYALHARLRHGKFVSVPDRILIQRKMIWKVIPWFFAVRSSKLREQETESLPVASLPFVRLTFEDSDPSRPKVHHDELYIKRFGWLSARYRASRYGFFTFWIIYQLVRATFIGGASSNPAAQVFGLLAIDVLGLLIIGALSPYESQRNVALGVWMLWLVKLVTTGLSVAFLPAFNLDRIFATVIGVIIIIAQGLLVIGLMILIILGGISSWMSLTRNQEYFSSRPLEGVRIRYFEHVAEKALDKNALKKLKPKSASRTWLVNRFSKVEAKNDSSADETEKITEMPKEPYFSVTSVRRNPKIEDDDVVDEDGLGEMEPHQPSSPRIANRSRRTDSVSSRHSISSLPRAAKTHRASWSSRDFTPSWNPDQMNASMDKPDSAYVQKLGGHHTPPTLSTNNLPGFGTPARNQVASSRPMTPTEEANEKMEPQ